MSWLGRERVAEALKKAHEAFPAWRSVTSKSRGEFLKQVAVKLERRRGDGALQGVIAVHVGLRLVAIVGAVVALAHRAEFASASGPS
jgi:acyl-CoA reductase-like NAD-dependent aldehyde dehydrogenase